MTRYLETPDIAERSYELLLLSPSRNGKISDREWDVLTEKKKTADEVRDFAFCGKYKKS